MTVPFFVEEPITWKKVEVPQEILLYCDEYTIDTDREDLRYLDCVYMNMGLYGNSPEQMREMRRRYNYSVRPIFD